LKLDQFKKIKQNHNQYGMSFMELIIAMAVSTVLVSSFLMVTTSLNKQFSQIDIKANYLDLIKELQFQYKDPNRCTTSFAGWSLSTQQTVGGVTGINTTEQMNPNTGILPITRPDANGIPTNIPMDNFIFHTLKIDTLSLTLSKETSPNSHIYIASLFIKPKKRNNDAIASSSLRKKSFRIKLQTTTPDASGIASIISCETYDPTKKSITSNELHLARHTKSDCTGAGGTVTEDTNGIAFCRFNAFNDACPQTLAPPAPQWKAYLSWTTTIPTATSGKDFRTITGVAPVDCIETINSCLSTGTHPWSNTIVEEIQCSNITCNDLKNNLDPTTPSSPVQVTVKSTVTEIGCY